MADRIGVIDKGALAIVEEKAKLMRELGRKQLTVHLQAPLERLPEALAPWNLALKADGRDLEYTFDGHQEKSGIPELLKKLAELGLEYNDLQTRQSTLEDIFVGIVHRKS